MSLDAARVRRILIIRPGGIGDASLVFPLLTALQGWFAGASIDILAERRNAGVFEINDVVDTIFRYDNLSRRGLIAALSTPYDLVVDTEQYHHLSALFVALTKAPYRCGFDTLGRGLFLTHRVPYRESEYEVDSFLRLAEAVIGTAISLDPGRPFVSVAPRWEEWAEKSVFGKARGAPVVVIVPATSTTTRVWPAERYRSVIRWLLGQGYAACLLGGVESVKAAAAIAEGLDSELLFNLVSRTTIPQSGAILKGAALYLGADCGVLHLAVGVGTPTVHMFGSGIQAKWAPVGPNYFLIDKRLTCSPCTRYGYTPACPYDAACMRAISIEEVIDTLKSVLLRKHLPGLEGRTSGSGDLGAGD